MATPRAAVKRTVSKPTAKVEAVVEELLVEAVEEAILEEIVEEVAEIVVEELKAEEPRTFLIHCIRDGATAFGNIWYVGQEVEVGKSSPAYRSTVDRNGDSWLEALESKPDCQNGTWKLGPATIPNELIDYPQNFDPHGMTYHKGEWFDLTMLRIRAEKEVARGRSIPTN
jgi:hypothetical protein